MGLAYWYSSKKTNSLFGWEWQKLYHNYSKKYGLMTIQIFWNYDKELFEKVLLKKQAVKEFIPVAAISDMTLLLAKDTSTTITGTSFTLDGGWTAQ